MIYYLNFVSVFRNGENFECSIVAYWGVKNANTIYNDLLLKGCIANEPITDVGGGILLGTVIDPAGNVFGIIENPHFKYEPAEEVLSL